MVIKDNCLSVMIKLYEKILQMITLFCRGLSMMTKRYTKDCEPHVQKSKKI